MAAILKRQSMRFVPCLSFHSLRLHELADFGTAVIYPPVDDVILDEFLGTVTRQCTVRHVQQLAQIDVIKQFIAVETVLQAVHAVQLPLYPLEAFQYCHDHLFYHFAIYIHGVISYSLNEYLILFSCALKRVYARYSEKDVPEQAAYLSLFFISLIVCCLCEIEQCLWLMVKAERL